MSSADNFKPFFGTNKKKLRTGFDKPKELSNNELELKNQKNDLLL
jgi:hypothetical protein